MPPPPFTSCQAQPTVSNLEEALDKLDRKHANLDFELREALETRLRQRGRLNHLQDVLRDLNAQRASLSMQALSLTTTLLPAKTAETTNLLAELLKGQDSVSDLKLESRTLRILLESEESKISRLEEDVTARETKWTEEVKRWLSSHELAEKRQELAEAKRANEAFERSHGTLERVNRDVVDLRKRLERQNVQNGRLETESLLEKESKAKNEAVVDQLRRKVRTLNNRKSAKLKLRERQ